jgi:hypothetical protein
LRGRLCNDQFAVGSYNTSTFLANRVLSLGISSTKLCHETVISSCYRPQLPVSEPIQAPKFYHFPQSHQIPFNCRLEYVMMSAMTELLSLVFFTGLIWEMPVNAGDGTMQDMGLKHSIPLSMKDLERPLLARDHSTLRVHHILSNTYYSGILSVERKHTSEDFSMLPL